MGVSLNGGFSQIIHFNRVFHYKPSILGCFPIFGNIHMANFPNCPSNQKNSMNVPSQSVGECAWGIFPSGSVGTVCGSDFEHFPSYIHIGRFENPTMRVDNFLCIHFYEGNPTNLHHYSVWAGPNICIYTLEVKDYKNQ